MDGGHPYRVYSAREQPEARRRIEETDAVAHPVYLLRSDFKPHWPAVYREFPEYQIVLWDTERVWIYTQDGPPPAGRVYAPVRNPHYNDSNYRAHVSLPRWVEASAPVTR